MGVINFIRDLWDVTHVNTDKKVYIPYGVSDIGEDFRKKEFSTDCIKIIMIADLQSVYDNYTPIFAVNECYKEGMDIKLDIYGKGKETKNIQKCINLQGCPNIEYKGEINDPTLILKYYDIFLTTSYSTDRQFNTIEALRCGLPVLIMDVIGNGASEFVKGNGYLMPENCIMHFRKTLKGFYDEKSQLIEMGQNSRKLYEEKFTAKQMVEKTVELYKDVLGE